MLPRTVVHWQSSVGVGDKFGAEQFVINNIAFFFAKLTHYTFQKHQLLWFWKLHFLPPLVLASVKFLQWYWIIQLIFHMVYISNSHFLPSWFLFLWCFFSDLDWYKSFSTWFTFYTMPWIQIAFRQFHSLQYRCLTEGLNLMSSL